MVAVGGRVPPQNPTSPTRAGQSPAKASCPAGLGLISSLGYTAGSAALPLHPGKGPYPKPALFAPLLTFHSTTGGQPIPPVGK